MNLDIRLPIRRSFNLNSFSNLMRPADPGCLRGAEDDSHLAARRIEVGVNQHARAAFIQPARVDHAQRFFIIQHA